MGTINYGTSDYITLGIKPAEAVDILSDAGFREWIEETYHFKPEDDESEAYKIAQDVAREYDIDDRENMNSIIEAAQPLHYYHVSIKPGYYEGYYLDIENNYSIAYDSYEDRREANKEITKIGQMLRDLAGCGIVSVWPGWCTTYRGYSETLEDIAEAVREMRAEVKTIPTWTQYEAAQEAERRATE